MARIGDASRQIADHLRGLAISDGHDRDVVEQRSDDDHCRERANPRKMVERAIGICGDGSARTSD